MKEKKRQNKAAVGQKNSSLSASTPNNDEDARFDKVYSDPKFRKLPKKERKVVVDERFQSMFTDSDFVLKSAVDKRGRSQFAVDSRDDLKKYYRQEDEEEVEQSEKGSESEEEEVKLDLARGEGNLSSSSSDDTDGSEWELENDQELIHDWGELDKDAPRNEVTTPRLAVCNMDWDRVSAKDIMVLMNSFKGPKGTVQAVRIYPSQYGVERMALEDAEGPPELKVSKECPLGQFDENSSNDEEDGRDEEQKLAEKVELEKLRKYQLNRMKYYYAVVTCDSAETANAIYSACDGVEFESSATRVDLRFIPNDMSFDEHEVKDEVVENPEGGSLALKNYEPLHFHSSALQQSTVRLTWDETPVKRKELSRQAFQKAATADGQNALDEQMESFHDLLASSSGSEDEGMEDKKIDFSTQKLLDTQIPQNVTPQDNHGVSSDVDMEFTWDPEKEEEGAEVGMSLGRDEKKKKKSQGWDAYLEKRKEKRRKRKQEIRDKREKSRKLHQEMEEVEGNVDNSEESETSSGEGERSTEERVGRFEGGNIAQADELALLTGRDVLQSAWGANPDTGHFDYRQIEKRERKLLKKQSSKKGAKGNPDLMAPSQNGTAADGFQVDVDDPRFEALYRVPEFAIDPSNQAFKKTIGMQKLLNEKVKKKAAETVDGRDRPDPGAKIGGDITECQIFWMLRVAARRFCQTSLMSLLYSIMVMKKHSFPCICVCVLLVPVVR